MKLTFRNLLLTLFTLYFTCHSYAWESNSWSTYAQRDDDVFNDINSILASVEGVDSSGNSVELIVACEPDSITIPDTIQPPRTVNLPSHHGPLLTLIKVDFDAWFGPQHPDQVRILSYSGRFKIDNGQTGEIEASMNRVLNKTLDHNLIVYPNMKLSQPSLKRYSDLTFLRELMAGSKFVIKPYESAELFVMHLDSSGSSSTIDLHKYLDKDEVMTFSLSRSRENIGNVIEFCEPYISKWEKAQHKDRDRRNKN